MIGKKNKRNQVFFNFKYNKLINLFVITGSIGIHKFK
jgi:hypothetical protein